LSTQKVTVLATVSIAGPYELDFTFCEQKVSFRYSMYQRNLLTPSGKPLGVDES